MLEVPLDNSPISPIGDIASDPGPDDLQLPQERPTFSRRVSRQTWHLSACIPDLEQLHELVCAYYHSRSRDDCYYFWLHLIKQITEFCGGDRLPPSKQELITPIQEPFESAIKSALALWTIIHKNNNPGQTWVHFEQKLLNIEACLSVSFGEVVDLFVQKRGVVDPWAHTKTAYTTERTIFREKPRAQDILFWTRFIGEEVVEVGEETFSRALYLHFQVVEEQDLFITADTMRSMVQAVFGLQPGGLVTRKRNLSPENGAINWKNFLQLFGPTLDKVYLHMCGLTIPVASHPVRGSVRGSVVKKREERVVLGPWLEYSDHGLENIECDMMVNLARNRDAFTVEYWVWPNSDEVDEWEERKPEKKKSKVVLEPRGYVGDKDTPEAFPTLRDFLLLYVCNRTGAKKMALSLDKEKLTWNKRNKRGEFAIQFGGDLRTNNAATSDVTTHETHLARHKFLMPELAKHLRLHDEVDKLTQILHERLEEFYPQLNVLFAFLKMMVGGVMCTDDLVVGVFLVLKPIVCMYISSRSALRATTREERADTSTVCYALINMIPADALITIDVEGLKYALESTSARLWAWIRAVIMAGDDDPEWVAADRDATNALSFATKIESMLNGIYIELDSYNNRNSYTRTQFMRKTARIALILPLPLAETFSNILRRKKDKEEDELVRDRRSRGVLFWSLFILSCLLYYAPIFNIVLYHLFYDQIRSEQSNGTGITIFEAYTPAVVAGIFGLVSGVTASWRLYEVQGACRRWMLAKMMMAASVNFTNDPELIVKEARKPKSARKSRTFLQSVHIHKSRLALLKQRANSGPRFGKKGTLRAASPRMSPVGDDDSDNDQEHVHINLALNNNSDGTTIMSSTSSGLKTKIKTKKNVHTQFTEVTESLPESARPSTMLELNPQQESKEGTEVFNSSSAIRSGSGLGSTSTLDQSEPANQAEGGPPMERRHHHHHRRAPSYAKHWLAAGGPEKYHGLNWFFNEYPMPRLRNNELSFIRILWSYFRGRTGAFLFVLLVAVGRSIFPILYRTKSKNHLDYSALSLGETWDQRVISLVGATTSFVGVTGIAFLLQASALHYLQILKWMDKAVSLAKPGTAAANGFTHYLPLVKNRNFVFWQLLRRVGKARVDDTVSVIVGVHLIVAMALIVAVFVELVVINGSDALFRDQAIFDSMLLCLFLTEILVLVVVLNEKVHRSWLEVLQGTSISLAKLKSSLQNKLDTARDEEVATRNDGRDVDAIEEHFQKVMRVQAVAADLRDMNACNILVESSMAAMAALDQPVTVIGIVVDVEFLVKLLAVLGSGIASAVVVVIRSG